MKDHGSSPVMHSVPLDDDPSDMTSTPIVSSPEKVCAVCSEEGSGIYFGAMVCLPCKVSKYLLSL